MTTDGMPERPEFENASTERILRRISEAILVSAETTRKAEESADMAIRQDFIASQVEAPEATTVSNVAIDGEAPDFPSIDVIEQAATRDPAADQPDRLSDQPNIVGAHVEQREDDFDFSLIAESPPMPDAIDPTVRQAIQFEGLQDEKDDVQPLGVDGEQEAEADAPQAPQPPVHATEFSDEDIQRFSFEGQQSSTFKDWKQPFVPPAPSLLEDPLQVGEQETLFHEDDDTVVKMASRWHEADREFRKGIMDVLERIIADLHADNARLMTIVRHFQQSRRSTR